MVRFAILLVVLALVAAVLGFTTIITDPMFVARILCFVLVGAAIAALVWSSLADRRLARP